MNINNFHIENGIYKYIELSTQELLEMDSIGEISQRIRACVNQYREQTDPHNTTYENITHLAEAKIGLEIMKEFSTHSKLDHQIKQDAIIVHSDNIGASTHTLFCHKDIVGIPEAKQVLDALTHHGMNVIEATSRQSPQQPTETLDM